MSRICRFFLVKIQENVTSKITKDSLYRYHSIAMKTGKKNNGNPQLGNSFDDNKSISTEIKVLGRKKKPHFFVEILI